MVKRDDNDFATLKVRERLRRRIELEAARIRQPMYLIADRAYELYTERHRLEPYEPQVIVVSPPPLDEACSMLMRLREESHVEYLSIVRLMRALTDRRVSGAGG